MNDANVLPSLEDVAHAQVNVLFDVLALLDGASAVIANEIPDQQPLDPDVVDRIIRQAKCRTQAVIDALEPHI